MRTIEHWIDGKRTAAGPTRKAPVFNPATGAQQAEVLLATKDDVYTAVGVAAHAFEAWSQTSLSRRAKVLFALRERVNGHTHELARWGVQRRAW